MKYPEHRSTLDVSVPLSDVIEFGKEVLGHLGAEKGLTNRIPAFLQITGY